MEIQERLKIYQEVYSELSDFAEEYISEFECADANFNGLQGIDIEGDNIDVMYEEYYSGCCSSYETHSISIPLSYFTDPAWMRKEQAIRMERNMVALKKQEDEKKLKAKKAKDDEYNKYLEMKEKFDGQD